MICKETMDKHYQRKLLKRTYSENYVRIGLSFYLCILTLFFSLSFNNLCFAQSVSQIERTREITEKEAALRNKLEKENKWFIKKIIVKGATLLSKDEIREIVLPFENHWLSNDDIKEIINLIKVAYRQKGYNNQPARIIHQVMRNFLKIKIEES